MSGLIKVKLKKNKKQKAGSVGSLQGQTETGKNPKNIVKTSDEPGGSKKRSSAEPDQRQNVTKGKNKTSRKKGNDIANSTYEEVAIIQDPNLVASISPTGSSHDLEGSDSGQTLFRSINANNFDSPLRTSLATSVPNPDSANVRQELASSPKASELDPEVSSSAKLLREWKPWLIKHYGYFDLFRYASRCEIAFMIIGTISAIAAGFCIPAMIYCFGKLIRVKVIADKMENAFHCKNSTGANMQNCQTFWDICENTTSDPTNFDDIKFIIKPIPPFKNITSDHMEEFVEWECLICIFYTVFSSIYFLCWSFASQSQGGMVRRAYYFSLLRKDMTWFNLQRNPGAINRAMENTRRISEGIGENIPVAINLTVMCLACIGLAFAHGWLFTLVSLVTVPLLVATTWILSFAKSRRILQERRSYRIPHELSKEVLSKMKSIIGYGSQVAEFALYKRELGRRTEPVMTAIVLQSVAVSFMYIINFGVWAIIFWYGTALVLFSYNTCTDKPKYDEYDAGDMVVIIMSVIFGCGNMYLVVIVLKSMQVAALCGRELFKVIEGDDGIDNMSKEGNAPGEHMKGKVEFFDVRFTYPGRKRTIALNHLHFVAEPNSTVGIVGLSESGKSTVLKLICKEYLPDSGMIKIDGKDIRSLCTRWLRSNIGYVPQKNSLFDMSIEDNLRMAKLNANFYEIQDACIKSGAHEFIVSFKKGYQTQIGYRGNLLTLGQQQQLALARALIRNPKILLMDEPTFALDSKNHADFMKTLQTISEGRTVIIVAHRLNSIVHANMIYVMKRGKVVEKGDHKTLLKNKGPYTLLSAKNRPSTSIRVTPILEGFDTSEMSMVSSVKTFNAKPILPNLYNNMLTVDPVVSLVTYAILKNDRDTYQGYHADLEWKLVEGEELQSFMTRYEDGLFGSNKSAGTPDVDSDVPGNIAESRNNMNRRSSSFDEDPLEHNRLPLFSPSSSNWLRILKMGSSSSKCLLCSGILSTICLAAGIPFFGLFFALIIEMLSDATLQPRNWIVAKRLGDHNYSSWIISSIAILGLYTGFFGFFQDLCLNIAAYKTVQKLRRLVYSSMLKQDLSFFDDPANNSAKLSSILFQDVDGIRHVTIGFYATFLQSFVLFVVAVVLCMVHAIKLTGYTLLIVCSAVLVNMFDGWLAKRQHARTIQTLQEMSRLILEVFQNKHIITCVQMEPYFIQKFQKLQIMSLTRKKRLSCVRIFTYGFSQSALLWGFAIFMWLGAERIRDNNEKFLNVMTICFVLIFGLVTLGTNLSVLMGFKHVNKGGERMLEIINRKPLLVPDEGATISKAEYNTGFEFFHTHFWKAHTQDVTLLKGINLVIPPLKVTAIIGSPESGKSAVLDILGRYYDATGGIVTIGGKDVRYYNAGSLRESISVVSKGPELFSRTVAQNIAMGDNTYQVVMSEIIRAAKEADVHNFIVSLPEGYETRIGGNHDYISAGQKYKISMARALLKNPQILLIDDITAYLDQEGESAVLESIDKAKENRTVVIISHRIQPVHKADNIAVMENGFLEESGTHEELLKRRPNGIYALMWRTQNPLEDENFLRGKVSFGPVKSKRLAPPVEQVEKPTPIIVEEPKKTPPPDKPQEKENEESAGLCGSLFGYLGMGIVELEEGHDKEKVHQQ